MKRCYASLTLSEQPGTKFICDLPCFKMIGHDGPHETEKKGLLQITWTDEGSFELRSLFKQVDVNIIGE